MTTHAKDYALAAGIIPDNMECESAHGVYEPMHPDQVSCLRDEIVTAIIQARREVIDNLPVAIKLTAGQLKDIRARTGDEVWIPGVPLAALRPASEQEAPK
jgi:hypothetical protein